MNSFRVWARMIKLPHTIFALPFALASGILASRTVSVTTSQWVAVVLAVLCARSTAMSFNRVVDRHIDAANPRTAGREIPTGQLSLRAGLLFTAATGLAFLAVCAMFGSLTLALAPVALILVYGYSLTKRFTAWCHVVLGCSLALAPTGTWIALTGTYSAVPALISIAVATWVAGFDILYATQDAEFDRKAGLYSVPASLGIKSALWLSSGLHAVTVAALASLPLFAPLGWPYAVGWLAIATVLGVEHSIVTSDDLRRIDRAFFDLNGVVSLVFLLAVWLA